LIVNVLNAALSLVIALSIPLPTWISPAVVAINLGIPGFSFVGGMWAQRREAKSMDAIMQKAKAEEAKAKRREQLVDSLDQELDTRLLRILVNSFLVLGCGAFLAAAIAIVGLVRATNLGEVVRPRLDTNATFTEEAALQFEFAGYTTWEKFTDNCCCQAKLSSENLEALIENGESVVELWKCWNVAHTSFLYKQRIRTWQSYSGFDLRPYCATDFTDEVDDLPKLDDESDENLVRAFRIDRNETDASLFAQTYLW
jgi:hypothetical protein